MKKIYIICMLSLFSVDACANILTENTVAECKDEFIKKDEVFISDEVNSTVLDWVNNCMKNAIFEKTEKVLEKSQIKKFENEFNALENDIRELVEIIQKNEIHKEQYVGDNGAYSLFAENALNFFYENILTSIDVLEK